MFICRLQIAIETISITSKHWSRNQQEQQQQQPPPPPPELLAPEASQPASQQHNDVNKPRINKSKATREREREAALTKHEREKREEPGSSRVRRVQLCHRFVACMQRRNLPAVKRR
ncbi:unnamed protein product [Sphagnum jensenii]